MNFSSSHDGQAEHRMLFRVETPHIPAAQSSEFDPFPAGAEIVRTELPKQSEPIPAAGKEHRIASSNRIEKEAPTYGRILRATDTDLDAIAVSKEAIPTSERTKLLKEAMRNYLQEVEPALSRLDEKATLASTMEAFIPAAERFLKPVMELYKDDPLTMLEDLSRLALEIEIEQRQNPDASSRRNERDDKLIGRIQAAFEKFDHVNPMYYHELFLDLKNGKTLEQIRSEYAVGNQRDRDEMEKAIQSLAKMQTSLMNEVLKEYRQGGSSPIPGLEVALDPKDYDICITLKQESLTYIDEHGTDKLDYRQNGNGTIDLKSGEGTFCLRPIDDSPDPTKRTYRLDLAGEKKSSGIM